jgi:hypothetical protein
MSPRTPDHDVEEEDEDPIENLPDGTKEVINRNGELRSRVSDEWFDPEFFDDEFEERPSTIIFDEGDAIPLELAGICWDAFHDSLEARDGNGQILSGTASSPGTTFTG